MVRRSAAASTAVSRNAGLRRSAACIDAPRQAAPKTGNLDQEE